jgi:hypothetical protein
MGEQPIVLQAIELTSRTLERRNKLYRALVVTVSLLAILSILSATFFRQWIFLSGLIFLVPLIGGFSYFDSRSVRRWRREIFRMRNDRNLDLNFFLKTTASLRRIFPPTAQAMFSTINLKRENEGRFDEQEQKSERLTLAATVLLTSALACFVGAAYYHSLTLVFCGIGPTLLLVFLRRRPRRK